MIDMVVENMEREKKSAPRVRFNVVILKKSEKTRVRFNVVILKKSEKKEFDFV